MFKIASRGFGIVFVTVIAEKIVDKSILPFITESVTYLLNTYRSIIGVSVLILIVYTMCRLMARHYMKN